MRDLLYLLNDKKGLTFGASRWKRRVGELNEEDGTLRLRRLSGGTGSSSFLSQFTATATQENDANGWQTVAKLCGRQHKMCASEEQRAFLFYMRPDNSGASASTKPFLSLQAPHAQLFERWLLVFRKALASRNARQSLEEEEGKKEKEKEKDEKDENEENDDEQTRTDADLERLNESLAASHGDGARKNDPNRLRRQSSPPVPSFDMTRIARIGSDVNGDGDNDDDDDDAVNVRSDDDEHTCHDTLRAVVGDSSLELALFEAQLLIRNQHNRVQLLQRKLDMLELLKDKYAELALIAATAAQDATAAAQETSRVAMLEQELKQALLDNHRQKKYIEQLEQRLVPDPEASLQKALPVVEAQSPRNAIARVSGGSSSSPRSQRVRISSFRMASSPLLATSAFELSSSSESIDKDKDDDDDDDDDDEEEEDEAKSVDVAASSKSKSPSLSSSSQHRWLTHSVRDLVKLYNNWTN
jgi:hypothetical protein